jgi:hypothetical protein
MKAYIATKKSGSKDHGFKAQYGLTIYGNDGKVLHSSTLQDDLSENKFENTLKAIEWGSKKIKTLTQNKSLPEEEAIILIISSKTVYGWFEKEIAPEPYVTLLSTIFLEMSFLLNHLEIILSESGDKRVLYRNTDEDKGTRVTDLLKSRV